MILFNRPSSGPLHPVDVDNVRPTRRGPWHAAQRPMSAATRPCDATMPRGLRRRHQAIRSDDLPAREAHGGTTDDGAPPAAARWGAISRGLHGGDQARSLRRRPGTRAPGRSVQTWTARTWVPRGCHGCPSVSSTRSRGSGHQSFYSSHRAWTSLDTGLKPCIIQRHRDHAGDRVHREGDGHRTADGRPSGQSAPFGRARHPGVSRPARTASAMSSPSATPIWIALAQCVIHIVTPRMLASE